MQLFKSKKFILIVLLPILLVGIFLYERFRILQTPSQISIDQLQPADCGVVLTGSPGRVREAFDVLAKAKINKLIVSGVHKDVLLKELFPQLATHPQVNSENIILEKISATTQQNAEQSLLLVQQLNCRNILLMTSQTHMYRAERTFKEVFPDHIEIRTYPIVNPNKEDSESGIIWETTKSLFYSIKYFISFNWL